METKGIREMTQLAPNQMVVTFDDVTVMPMVKKAIELMRGVKTVKTSHTKKMTGLEKALEDVKAGRISKWDSVDQMFDTILG